MFVEDLAKSIARGVIALLIIAALWQVPAAMGASPLAMPTLRAVLTKLVQLCTSLPFWGNVWVTVQDLVLGYVPALIGIPLGLALAAVTPLRFVFGGFFNGLAAAPLIAGAPLMTLWFGIGDNAKIALVFVVAVFSLTSDVMTGLAPSASSVVPGNVAPVAAPGTARCIIAALRRAFMLAVTAVLVAEMVASAHGLGYLLMTSVSMFDLAQTAAVLLIVALPCAIVAAIARGIEGLV